MQANILNTSPSADDSKQYTLHEMVGNDRFYEKVKARVKDPNERDDWGHTLLHEAAYSHEDTSRMVHFLLYRGAEVDSTTPYGHTPLHFAVASRKRDTVTSLIEAGASIKSEDVFGRTILHFAIGSKWWHPPIPILNLPCDMWIVDKLLVHPEIMLNPVDQVGNTPLMWAVKAQNLDAVEALLRKGANPNIPNVYNQTPLHKALLPRNPSHLIVFALLTHGADIYCGDNVGRTPVDILIRNIPDSCPGLLASLSMGFQDSDQDIFVRNVGRLLLAKLVVGFIALRYQIRDSLKRKLEKNPILSNHLEKCCEEVKLMKRMVIYDKVTLHDFACNCFHTRFVEPVLEVYLPVVGILLTGFFSEYLYFMLRRISINYLRKVLEKVSGASSPDDMPPSDASYSTILDAIKQVFLN